MSTDKKLILLSTLQNYYFNKLIIFD